MKKLFRNALIVTMNQHNEVLHHASLGIENDRIIYVGPELDNTSAYDKVIDVQGKIIMPGLINTHGHAAMSLLRGYADDKPLQQWLETLWPLEEKMTPENIKWGTQLSLLEMIKSGTTCFMDMYDHMDVVAHSVIESGMRAVLARGVIGLCPPKVQQAKLIEAKTFAKQFHQAGDGRITTMMSPHGVNTCPRDYLIQIVEAAHELNLPIHMHMSETAQEVAECFKTHQALPVFYLRDIGVFNRPTLVAHAVHVTDKEMELLKRFDVKIAHCPISNLKLGSGIAPIPDLLKKNITVSLGTDSAASNNNLNLFEEIKITALLHKGLHQDPTLIDATTALRMATIEGAKALCLDKETGSLECNKLADFIVIRTDNTAFYPNHDPISYLVYAATGQEISDVYVSGKPLLLNGECQTLDKDKIIHEANRGLTQLLSR